MQVKIIIGTVAFMISMMVLGYAALREPGRLERYTDARQGRQIEMGAHLYDANCATCHGVDGKAEECYDPSSGEPIGCVGLPLNYAPLVCGDLSLRMEAMNWEGSKETFIQSTLTSGRPGTVMPAWAEQFGGPLRPDQIVDLSKFVLNWETEELCSQPLVVYEWQESVEEFNEEFPEGDAARGEELFLSYGCTGCHGNLEDDTSALVGPWLGDITERGAEQIDGYSAADYVYESILESNAFIAPDCPTGPCVGPPGAMPDNFDLRMGENPQDLRDLMTFLLGE
ncbi:MAG: c-type cytochrome [Chloroflexi bacterium]|jgi:mono/diheme cytochrome c family protein|nr:c-type cytochrome [Chloroflexota bacterium]